MALATSLSSEHATARPLGLKLAVAVAGALVVAAAAQVAIPVLGSPVPFTLQPLAVLIVGGLLGPRYGVVAMAAYLAMGAAGLPVFTPVGLPGFARLTGPTGGYLIAYPLAAFVVGKLSTRSAGGTPALWTVLLAAVAGLVIIHAGGMAQLKLITGSADRAIAQGLLPFLLGDLVKALIAAIVIRRFFVSTRALT